MSLEISQSLMLERAAVVYATILLFGLVSIGGLVLWRRFATQAKAQSAPAGAGDWVEDIVAIIRQSPTSASNLTLSEIATRLEVLRRSPPITESDDRKKTSQDIDR